MELTDTLYEVESGLAWITIDRPNRMNAFAREDGR
jgi:enoyl-CoA hydratase/carnithine racemase